MSISTIIGAAILFCATIYAALAKAYKFGPFLEQPIEPVDEIVPPAPPQPLPEPPPIPIPTPAPGLDFSTPKAAYHSTRVVCDEMGLSIQKTILVNGRFFAPKDIICACIYQESRFDNTAVGRNKNTEGKILSTDYGAANLYGMVQVNDYWHIGVGKQFPSVQYVIDHPEEVVRWMVTMYKAGQIRLWVSYTSGAYKQWLSPSSPMWLLKGV